MGVKYGVTPCLAILKPSVLYLYTVVIKWGDEPMRHLIRSFYKAVGHVSLTVCV